MADEFTTVYIVYKLIFMLRGLLAAILLGVNLLGTESCDHTTSDCRPIHA